MPLKSTGELEASISNAIVKFEVEYMGRGPKNVKTYIFDESVFVKLHGVLTKAEKELVKKEDCGSGVELIKKVRTTLLENCRPHLNKIIQDILGVEVKHFHTDFSTTNEERIIIFTMAKKIRDYHRCDSSVGKDSSNVVSIKQD